MAFIIAAVVIFVVMLALGFHYEHRRRFKKQTQVSPAPSEELLAPRPPGPTAVEVGTRGQQPVTRATLPRPPPQRPRPSLGGLAVQEAFVVGQGVRDEGNVCACLLTCFCSAPPPPS